jgi:Tfp pilus assembly protein PilV
MRASLLLVVLIPMLGLAGCDGTDPPLEKQSAAAQDAQKATQLRDYMERDKAKAQAAADQAVKDAEAQRKQIEDAGG